MTQPSQETVELPVAEAPWAQQVVALSPFPDVPGPVIWVVGQQHPFTPELSIVRIYVHPGVDVAVYSRHKDGKVGVRNVIPWHEVKLPVEAMDPQTFVDEIAAEEADDEEEEEEEEVPQEPPRAAAGGPLQPMPPVANGA